MRNAFVTRCTFCKKRCEPGQAEMVPVRGRLIPCCLEHTDRPFSQAQVFARDTDQSAAEEHTIEFPDGSLARFRNGRWRAVA